MNVWYWESCRSIQDVHHVYHPITYVPGGSPRRIRGSRPALGLAFVNCTRNDLHRGSFGKNDGNNPHNAVSDHRLVRRPGRRPTSSPQLSSILVATMCLGMYCPYLCRVTHCICNTTRRISSAQGRTIIRFTCLWREIRGKWFPFTYS